MIAPEIALALAMEEFRSPTLAVTNQYLAVHRVATDEQENPIVPRIDGVSEADASKVYFSLVDFEGAKLDYYLVVRICRKNEDEHEIGGVWVAPRIQVYITVASESMTPDELTSVIGLEPTRSWAKGSPKNKRGGFPVHSHSRWLFEAIPDLPADLDEKLQCLHAEIHAASATLASLGESCEIVISIILDEWTGNHGSVPIGADSIRWISVLGASIDIGVYSWGPEMLEDS